MSAKFSVFTKDTNSNGGGQSQPAAMEQKKNKTYAAAVAKSDQSDYETRNRPGIGMPGYAKNPISNISQERHLQNNQGLRCRIPNYIREINADILINDVNPDRFIEPHKDSKYFVIKSYSEEDVHKAIKYSIWSSSKGNNKILDDVYNQISKDKDGVVRSCDMYSLEDEKAFLTDRPMVFLFFSVNGSGNFCGVARIASTFHSDRNAEVWCDTKWSGLFYIRWLYVKDVPNPHLKHIRFRQTEKNYGKETIKPVTITRDCTEVVDEENGKHNGVRFLDVFHHYKYTTTLFDDYDHYDEIEINKSRTGQ